jgi:hypothetical protein
MVVMSCGTGWLLLLTAPVADAPNQADVDLETSLQAIVFCMLTLALLPWSYFA